MSAQNIGEKLRRLREENQLSLGKVADLMDIDTAILGEIERGERQLTKELVQKLANIYKHGVIELTELFLKDKVAYENGEENTALKALKASEKDVVYAKQAKTSNKSLIYILTEYLKSDQRIKTAWLFGSFARGDEQYNSDIDLMVSFNSDQRISLFDFADIEYQLRQKTKRKVDLVEEGCLLPFAYETAKNDLIKIYG